MGFKKGQTQSQPADDAPPAGVVSIRGKGGKVKQYSTVALRIKQFWDDPKHEGWHIITKVISADEQKVVMRCKIKNEMGVAVATGHAEEWRGTSDVNSTSALENAETSAIGRALAALGIGGESFASADEVQNAMAEQDRLAEVRDKYLPLFEEAASYGMEALADFYTNANDGQDNWSNEDIRSSVQGEMPRLKEIAAQADANAEAGITGGANIQQEEMPHPDFEPPEAGDPNA